MQSPRPFSRSYSTGEGATRSRGLPRLWEMTPQSPMAEYQPPTLADSTYVSSSNPASPSSMMFYVRVHDFLAGRVFSHASSFFYVCAEPELPDHVPRVPSSTELARDPVRRIVHTGQRGKFMATGISRLSHCLRPFFPISYCRMWWMAFRSIVSVFPLEWFLQWGRLVNNWFSLSVS